MAYMLRRHHLNYNHMLMLMGCKNNPAVFYCEYFSILQSKQMLEQRQIQTVSKQDILKRCIEGHITNGMT